MKRLLCLSLILLLLLSGCTTPQPEASATEPSNEPFLVEEEEIGYLSVHFIDIGQADAILLICDEGAVLIDGGNVGTELYLLNYLQRYGVDELDLMINTHPHGDHIAGLPPVLSNIPTETLWVSTMRYNSYQFDRLLQNANKQDCDVLVPAIGQTYTLGALELTVLGPLGSDYEDLNDTSLVVMAEFGERRFLFTGDMEAFAEEELVDAKVDLKADVLKVGHHGSYSSSSYPFLRAVKPDFGVISCGRDNEYGHPHGAPLERLNNVNVSVLRTDLMGNVTVTTDGTNMAFFWEWKDAMPTNYPNAA